MLVISLFVRGETFDVDEFLRESDFEQNSVNIFRKGDPSSEAIIHGALEPLRTDSGFHQLIYVSDADIQLNNEEYQTAMFRLETFLNDKREALRSLSVSDRVDLAEIVITVRSSPFGSWNGFPNRILVLLGESGLTLQLVNDPKVPMLSGLSIFGRRPFLGIDTSNDLRERGGIYQSRGDFR